MSLLSFLNGGYKPYCFIFIEITYAESSGKSAKAWLAKHELLSSQVKEKKDTRTLDTYITSNSQVCCYKFYESTNDDFDSRK